MHSIFLPVCVPRDIVNSVAITPGKAKSDETQKCYHSAVIMVNEFLHGVSAGPASSLNVTGVEGFATDMSCEPGASWPILEK